MPDRETVYAQDAVDEDEEVVFRERGDENVTQGEECCLSLV
jgi:hypothetical protein